MRSNPDAAALALLARMVALTLQSAGRAAHAEVTSMASALECLPSTIRYQKSSAKEDLRTMLLPNPVLSASTSPELAALPDVSSATSHRSRYLDLDHVDTLTPLDTSSTQDSTFKSSQRLPPPSFEDFDLNNDGVISFDEFKEVYPQHQPHSGGREPMAVLKSASISNRGVEPVQDRSSYSDRISDIVGHPSNKVVRHPCVLCGGAVGNHQCGACCGVFCQACCVGAAS